MHVCIYYLLLSLGAFRDVESCDEDIVTTRHTISSPRSPRSHLSLGPEPGTPGVVRHSSMSEVAATPGKSNTAGAAHHNNNSSSGNVLSVMYPHTIDVHPSHTHAHASKYDDARGHDFHSFSAPPVALKRDYSQHSLLGDSPRSPRSPRHLTNDDHTSSSSSKSHQVPHPGTSLALAGIATHSVTPSAASGWENPIMHAANEELIRYPAKLARMLERARAKRGKIEARYNIWIVYTHLHINLLLCS